MSTVDWLARKQALHAHCLALITERLDTVQASLQGIEEARNNETKSSAGDKHETGRAMMQIQEEQLNQQLRRIADERSQLQRIDPAVVCERGQPGALLRTGQGIYFLAVGLGRVTLNEEVYFCVSPQAPIGQLLLDKRAGDALTFNGRRQRIEAIA